MLLGPYNYICHGHFTLERHNPSRQIINYGLHILVLKRKELLIVYTCLNVFKMIKVQIPMVGGGGTGSETIKKHESKMKTEELLHI